MWCWELNRPPGSQTANLLEGPDFDDQKVKIEMYIGLCLQYFVLRGLTKEKIIFFQGYTNTETAG